MPADKSPLNPFQPPASRPDDDLRATTSWRGSVFSFQGRIKRSDFCRYSIAGSLIFVGTLCCGVFVTQYALHVFKSQLAVLAGMLATTIACVLYLWLFAALCVKRLHDRNQVGTQVLYGLLPIGGWIWLFVECGCLPGTAGSNDYGPEPV